MISSELFGIIWRSLSSENFKIRSLEKKLVLETWQVREVATGSRPEIKIKWDHKQNWCSSTASWWLAELGTLQSPQKKTLFQLQPDFVLTLASNKPEKLFPRWPGHFGKGSLNSCQLLKVHCNIFYMGMVWVWINTINQISQICQNLRVCSNQKPSGPIIQIDLDKLLQSWLLIH